MTDDTWRRIREESHALMHQVGRLQQELQTIDDELEALGRRLARLMDSLRAERVGARVPHQPWGVMTRFEAARRNGDCRFVIDDEEVTVEWGKVAALGLALAEPGGAQGPDGLSKSIPWLIDRVAQLTGSHGPQSPAALRGTIYRLKRLFKPVRDDWRELVVWDRSVNGYRLALERA
jgi:hypothetical protein